MTDSRLRRAARFTNVYWRAALGSAYALTLGLRTRRHRGLLTQVARHFGYDHNAVDATLPTVPVTAVVPAHLGLDMRELAAVDGNVSVLELVVLAATAARLHARTVFEIGTFDGRTTVNFAANAAPDAAIYTLDLPPEGADTMLDPDQEDLKYMQGSVSGARIRGSDVAPRVRQLYGDSATFDFSVYAGKIDLCFVDGAHSRDYVLNDSRHAMAMTHARSVILWHDYAMWPGVTAALNELHASGGVFAGLRRIEGTTLAVLDRSNGAR